MKLEKREITLNEADSLKDIFYLEKTLLREYEEGEDSIKRKELENELPALMTKTKEDIKKVFSLWQQSQEGKFY